MKTAQISIAQDPKLSDVVTGLNDPIEYIRNVLAVLNEHGAGRNPKVRIRWSLQSDRAAPNYQIIEIMDAETGQPMGLEAYSGRTHRALAYNEKLALTHWSTESCSFAEVQKLIGALRKAAKSTTAFRGH